MCPTCGSTLCLGSPHKNSGLRRCSTRQLTVYSYTASHRSPCLGQVHQHISTIIIMITTIPTHIKLSTLCDSKHAISCNSCRGHMINNQLLNLLGLWFAYYCDKMIGHAKEWVQLCDRNALW